MAASPVPRLFVDFWQGAGACGLCGQKNCRL